VRRQERAALAERDARVGASDACGEQDEQSFCLYWWLDASDGIGRSNALNKALPFTKRPPTCTVSPVLVLAHYKIHDGRKSPYSPCCHKAQETAKLLGCLRMSLLIAIVIMPLENP
jgi:hypothetical protein